MRGSGAGWGGERRQWVGRCFLLPCTLTPAGASKLPGLQSSSLTSLSIHHLSPHSSYVGGQSDRGGKRPWWRKVDRDGEKDEGKVVPPGLLGMAPKPPVLGAGESDARPGS